MQMNNEYNCNHGSNRISKDNCLKLNRAMHGGMERLTLNFSIPRFKLNQSFMLLVPCNYIQTWEIFVKNTYRARGAHNIWIPEKLQPHTKHYYSHTQAWTLKVLTHTSNCRFKTVHNYTL
jgi:hypothetical protein